VDGLSPETRALLDCARDGDRLGGDRREALRQGVATALGAAVAGIPCAATSARWALRTFGALGATGAAIVFAVGLHGVLVHESPRPRPRSARASQPRQHRPRHPARRPRSMLPPRRRPRPPTSAKLPRRATRPACSDLASKSPRPPTRPTYSDLASSALRRPEGDALAAEARLLAAAQSAVDLRHGAHALALLGEHDRRFPAGVLAPESEALRVDALCAAGRADDANAEAFRPRTRGEVTQASARVEASTTVFIRASAPSSQTGGATASGSPREASSHL
jgi:hypothetical protein